MLKLVLEETEKRLYLQLHFWVEMMFLAQSEPLKFTGALAPVQLVKQLRHAVSVGFHEQTPTMVTMIHSHPFCQVFLLVWFSNIPSHAQPMTSHDWHITIVQTTAPQKKETKRFSRASTLLWPSRPVCC